jgi:hypothetical protein
MDAYDTGKGLPEQIDREGNTGFMQKIAAHPAVKPYVFTVSGYGGTFIQLLSTAAFAAFNTHLIRRTLSVHLAPTWRGTAGDPAASGIRSFAVRGYGSAS